MIITGMERKFKKNVSSLDDLCEFIEQFSTQNRLTGDISFALNLAAEEIFTNLVKYNTRSRNEIHIILQKETDRITVKLTDFDVDSFDITQLKPYDIHQTLHDRPVGKLGIHIVKQLMDRISYHYQDRNSTITLVKYVRKEYV
jgi:anti-sigma regulatory factor (Ser/Thr protein kinase)